MSSGDEDARLRAAMSEAHRQDLEHTPSFDQMWRRSRPRRATWRWSGLAAGLAAAAAGIWLVTRPSPPSTSWPAIDTRWVGPTDFLLETPDLITLRSLPPLDPAHDRFMLCGSPHMLEDTRRLLDERGFVISPRIGEPGDYVIERAFVEK